MASELADKIRKTQNSFVPRPPGAIESCPLSKPLEKKEPPPIDVKTAFALTQDILQAMATEKPVDQKPKKDWIEIILVDSEGKPMPGVRYRITPPGGGAPQEGRLNEHGQAGLYQIEAGNCKITFPDLDKDAWE